MWLKYIFCFIFIAYCQDLNCQSGYHYNKETNACYKIYVTNTTRRMTMNDASLFCMEENAGIVNINSIAETNFVYDLITYNTYYSNKAGRKLLIGAKSNILGDTNTVKDQDYEVDYPNSFHCTAVQVKSNGITTGMRKWMKLNCDDYIDAFICKAKPIKGPIMTPKKCRKDYVYRPRSGLCYTIISPKPSYTVYEAAVRSCKDEFGQMVSIHSTQEMKFVIKKLVARKTTNVTKLYLGLMNNSNGEYSWGDGTKFDYQNWHPTKVEQNLENFCVEMDSKTGYWNGIPCMLNNQDKPILSSGNAGIICQTFPIFANEQGKKPFRNGERKKGFKFSTSPQLPAMKMVERWLRRRTKRFAHLSSLFDSLSELIQTANHTMERFSSLSELLTQLRLVYSRNTTNHNNSNIMKSSVFHLFLAQLPATTTTTTTITMKETVQQSTSIKNEIEQNTEIRSSSVPATSKQLQA